MTAPNETREAYAALVSLTEPCGVLDLTICVLEDGGYNETADVLRHAWDVAYRKARDIIEDFPELG